MSRPLRIEFPGAWYHVMNRTRRSERLFITDADRNAFVQVMQEAAELWNFRIAAYCLMSNHYHLLLQTPDANLARGMRHINGVYTQRFNRRHHKDGQLFRGRYKAVLVDDDSHLLEVLRYIHRNPLRAGIVKTLGEYPWSSHKAYLSQEKKWSWLHRDDLQAMLTTVKTKQKRAYIDFVSQGEPEAIEKFYSLKNLPSILGSDFFKEYMRERFSNLLNQPETPEAKVLAPPAEQVISAVCGHFRISREQLFLSKRGTENLPRDVAVYLVRRLCRLTLPQVGEEFGITHYSSVSSVVQRTKHRIESDKRLLQELNIIIKKAIAGQKRT